MFSAISSLLNKPIARSLTRNALLAMDPEQAHKASILALKSGLVTNPLANSSKDAKELNTNIAGITLSNPFGMAAGFDKNAQVYQSLSNLGFGFCEVGTITPKPQMGNPKPRLFRLMASRGIINRMGFNNQGHDAVYASLEQRDKHIGAPVGINIGANKDSEDFVGDYVLGVKRFASLANYLTMNISSPNTPGLRGLQSPQMLERLLNETLNERARQADFVPVFLKIAPDLSLEAMDDIATIIAKTDLDGLIVSNTTIRRDFVEGQANFEQAGGLSGQPIFELSTIRLAQMRQRVGPDLAIIGVGGVHSSASALAKFQAGANAIQLYSALVFGGLELLDEIKGGLLGVVRDKGLKNISQLVGSKTDFWANKQI